MDKMEDFNEGKNKSTGKTVTIIILLILLISSFIYIGYFDIYEPYYSKPNSIKEDVENEEDENRDMYVNEEVKMTDKINDYLYFSYDFSKEKVENFDNQDLLRFAVQHTKDNNEEISKDEIEEIIDNYFGDNVKLKHEDIICNLENTALYKFENDKYVLNDNHPGHGGGNITQGEVHIISGEVNLKDKEYILKSRILYNQIGESGLEYTRLYYKSVEDIENNNPIINTEIDNKTYEDVKSFLPITTFTFTKKGKNYYLKSVKVE